MAWNEFVPGELTMYGESLGRQIATAMERGILSGPLVASESVSRESLCLRLGTSRIPARDALQDLAAADYVLRGAGNQVRVAELEPPDIDDLLFLEAPVTGLIARRAAEHITEHRPRHRIECKIRAQLKE
jgi:DNA-binding GntR family transcriptional regulator